MKNVIYSLSVIFALASCSNKKEMEIDRLQRANDSLVVVNTQSRTEFDELLSTLNMVEDGFSKIKESENYLVIQSQSNNDLSKSTKARLMDDITLINQTLKENREKIDKLQKLYNNSSYRSNELKKTIERLTQEIETKTAMIAQLQEELSKRDTKIKELTSNVEALTNETNAQKAVLAAQDQALNTAYYVVATKKVLKNEQIISGGGLFSSLKIMKGELNNDLFTKVDVRKVTEIPLNTKDKAKVLTNMPSESYAIVRGDDGNLVLQILDIEKFWGRSKYLVVQID